MRGIWRLTLVSLLAVIAFGVALVNFREVPARECQMDAVRDPSFQVEFLTPFSVDPTTHLLRVTRDGAPVTGAQVCVRADMGGMGGMSGMGISDVAREIAPGQYEAPIRFEMGGFWNGTVIVDTATREPVMIPVPIEVR